MKIGNLDLKWLGHSSIFIKANKAIYIDPYNILRKDSADIILLTHPHYDHCSLTDINKIVKDGTIIIGPAGCQSKIAKIDKKVEMKIINPGQNINIFGIKINAIPAYNIGKEFHSKEESWVGYLIEINGAKIYHAGDTDIIPEMKQLPEKIIALLPVGGKFTMNADEAAQAVSIIKPALAVPIHWGAGVAGEKSDADKFVSLCKEKGFKAEILEKE